MNLLLNSIASLLIFFCIIIIAIMPFVLNKEEEQDLEDRKDPSK